MPPQTNTPLLARLGGLITAIMAVAATVLLLRTGQPALARLAEWFSIARHAAGASGFWLSDVYLTTMVPTATALALFAFAISSVFRIGSASNSNAYVAGIEIIGLVSAVIAVTVAAWLDRQAGTALRLIAPAVAIAVTIYVFWSLHERSTKADKAPLFVLFEIWSQRQPKDDEIVPPQSLTDFLRDPTDPTARALASLLPVAIAASTVVSGTALIVFGWGVASSLAPILSSFAEADWEVKSSITDVLRRSSITLAHLIPFVALLALLFTRILYRKLRDVDRPIPVRLGLFALYALAALALLSIVIFGLFNASKVLANGPGIILALLIPALLVAVLALHRSSSVALRAITAAHAVRSRRFWVDTHWIWSQVPNPSESKGYVFLHTQSDTYSIASLLLVLTRLKQLGWTVIVMDRWPFLVPPTGQKHLDRFSAVKLGDQRTLNYQWHIDWDHQRVEAAGINFYHPIWEGLSRHFGRYSLNLETDTEAEQVFRDILQIADATLLMCFRLQNSIAGNGKPVRIIGSSAQFVPNAIINMFCRAYGIDRDMHFCWVQQGYQTYYADNAKLSKRISLQNMTRKWPYSNPYLPHTDDFEAWIAKGQDTDAILAEAEKWAATARATSADDMKPVARETYERIIAHRKAGGAVVCVLGKMVFDLSTPYESGPAHEGMLDWLNHTVATARDAPDVLYLIKPHPYESRPEIAGRVEQFFTDMIESTLPTNVLILGHDWFNLYSLFPLIDLGVMWNGTSGLELGLREIPVIMCSDWGPIDYPIGFPVPRDRSDYEYMIKHPKAVILPERYKERCALLLKYTSTDEVMVPYDYAARPLTNAPFGPPYWYMDQVRKFLADGDPHIDYASSRIY